MDKIVDTGKKLDSEYNRSLRLGGWGVTELRTCYGGGQGGEGGEGVEVVGEAEVGHKVEKLVITFEIGSIDRSSA